MNNDKHQEFVNDMKQADLSSLVSDSNTKQSIVYVDPPSGWKYGFPKPLPPSLSDSNKEEFEAWLVANGYPQSEVDYWNKSERFKEVPCSFFVA